LRSDCPPAESLRQTKHRLIAKETREHYRAKPLYKHGIDDELAAAFLAWGLPLRIFTRPPRHTCQARTRRGTACRALALENGRCRNHGGLSTGPKTTAGWRRTRAGYRAWLKRKRGPG
jgi:hypothetical protein